jgi:hypothetical protein
MEDDDSREDSASLEIIFEEAIPSEEFKGLLHKIAESLKCDVPYFPERDESILWNGSRPLMRDPRYTGARGSIRRTSETGLTMISFAPLVGDKTVLGIRLVGDATSKEERELTESVKDYIKGYFSEKDDQ